MLRLPQAKSVVRNAGPGTRLVVAALLSVAVGIAVLKWVPGWIATTPASKEEAEELGRVRTAVLAVLAGSLAVVGAITAHRGYVVTREGQVTERFTRAVDQLGSASLDVRLGGIYALERIARESAVDHGPIIEILTAWLRGHTFPAPDDDPEAIARVAADAQAVLNVLGRRRVDQDSGILDLSGIAVYGASLRGVQFATVRGAGAELISTDLSVASLQGADLRSANLYRSSFQGAFLVEADLREAHAARADFGKALMFGVRLDSSRFSNAKFVGALLSDASLVDALLSFADFTDAVLTGTDMTGADLSGACFVGASLVRANLSGATLDGADLRSADLSQTDFSGATIDAATRADVDLETRGARRTQSG